MVKSTFLELKIRDGFLGSFKNNMVRNIGVV